MSASLAENMQVASHVKQDVRHREQELSRRTGVFTAPTSTRSTYSYRRPPGGLGTATVRGSVDLLDDERPVLLRLECSRRDQADYMAVQAIGRIGRRCGDSHTQRSHAFERGAVPVGSGTLRCLRVRSLSACSGALKSLLIAHEAARAARDPEQHGSRIINDLPQGTSVRDRSAAALPRNAAPATGQPTPAGKSLDPSRPTFLFRGNEWPLDCGELWHAGPLARTRSTPLAS